MVRRVWLGVAFVSIAGAVTGFAGCVGDDPLPSGSSSGEPEAGPSTNKKELGTTCAGADECGSGFCTDGVCCESTCSGVCEACNVNGSAGKCAPVPAGEDPANECKVQEAIEAGVVDDDAGSADGGEDGGEGIALPDAGITREPAPCAPKCNGQRACGYPDSKQKCGTAFCNGTSETVFPSCDGRGNCEGLTQEVCSAYVCDSTGSCKTSCAAPSDCQDTHYCSAAGKCEPKKAVGTACALPSDCTSGFCEGDAVSKVCCETACSGDISLSCVTPGNQGKCMCKECATGPCKLYYEDKDGDTYGDRDATVLNGKAKYACADVTPVGFSVNNLDCYDVNDANGKNVNPGQKTHSKDGYGPGADLFDWNCDGKEVKYYAESPGVTSCTYCTGTAFDCNPKSPNTCTSPTQSVGHRCGLVTTYTGTGIPLRGCGAIYQTSFRANVECGKSATLYTCNECLIKGNGPAATSTAPGTYQKCL